VTVSSHGFMWMGQPFSSCDECGRPAWEHSGMHEPGALFDVNDLGTIRPWRDGEADAIKAKWADR